MKVMISMPMNGRETEDIKKDMEKYKKEFAKLHIDTVNSLFDAEFCKTNYNTPALYYLAKSIDMIGRVDAVFFAKDWKFARGCKIEREVCRAYEVKILDEDFITPNPTYTATRLYANDECVKEIIDTPQECVIRDLTNNHENLPPINKNDFRPKFMQKKYNDMIDSKEE